MNWTVRELTPGVSSQTMGRLLLAVGSGMLICGATFIIFVLNAPTDGDGRFVLDPPYFIPGAGFFILLPLTYLVMPFFSRAVDREKRARYTTFWVGIPFHDAVDRKTGVVLRYGGETVVSDELRRTRRNDVAAYSAWSRSGGKEPTA